MKKRRCEGTASFRYTWPGQKERSVCAVHAVEARRLAEVMGFPLDVRVIPMLELREDRLCDQEVADR